MDGKEAMAFPNSSSPYYFHRGGPFVPVSAPQGGAIVSHRQSGLRPMSNPNLSSQSNAGPPPFLVGEARHGDSSHGIHMGMAAASSALVVQSPTEPVAKKKRGRPRKYLPPDGQVVSLGLSSLPAANNKPMGTSLSDTQTPKRARGRPPGTGRKQRLANLGEWMNSSAGFAFAPHVISVGVGEDIVSKVLSFSQQRPRALCILSGNGTVSSVTLRQPASTVPSVTFEGRFDILCLSGSYLVNEEGGPRSRTGGISVSLCSPEGHVIGGGAGMLIASSLIQVVACSFVYGNSKGKIKQDTGPKEEDMDSGTPASAPAIAPTTQNFTASAITGWPGSGLVDSRNHHTGIDLTRG